MKKLSSNTKIVYEPVNDVSGKTLPETFTPLFETDQFFQTLGELRGKYIKVSNWFLDAVNFTWFDKMPVEDPKDSWQIYDYSLVALENEMKCPLSDITVTSTEMFQIVQENDRWLLVRRHIGGGRYFVEKKLAVDGKLVFEHEKAFYLPGSGSQSIFEPYVQLLPNSQGAFMLEFPERGQAQFGYLDLEKRAGLVVLANFPAQSVDYFFWGYNRKVTRGRDFVIPYKGTLWLNYQERVLIPLWADLSGDPTCGVPDNRKSVIIRSSKSPNSLSGNSSYRLIRSVNKRWVSYVWSRGRIVCDLDTSTTYIVRDRGWKMYPGASFVELSEDGNTPIFYTMNVYFLRRLRDRRDNWEFESADPDPEFADVFGKPLTLELLGNLSWKAEFCNDIMDEEIKEQEGMICDQEEK
ncbi:hypothetical protein CJU89_5228 [Yarrowia sp. B02]|nr:hypothetical protein CJU89_5228 [Yarrowia sp. B02]